MLSPAHVPCRTSLYLVVARKQCFRASILEVRCIHHRISTRAFATSKSSKPAKKIAPSHLHPAKPVIQNTASASAPPLKPFHDPPAPPLRPSNDTFRGTTGTALSAPSTTTKSYPERLLIYHAGTGRLVFISMIKLSTIFLFIFCSLYIAPAYYYSPLEDTYKAFVVLAGGAVPMLVMRYTTAPFVAYVHLALPAWARSSQGRLHRYASNLPAKAALDVTSLKWVWPRVSRLAADELHFKRTPVLGSMTLRRTIPKVVWEEKKWYAWKPLGEFYVAGRGGKVPEQGIWEEVLDCIRRGFGKYGDKVILQKSPKAPKHAR